MRVYVVIVLRGGSVDQEKLISFFSRLTNSEVHENSIINLSSGQASRAYAWLITNGVAIDGSVFNAPLRISDLLGQGRAEGVNLINDYKNKNYPEVQGALSEIKPLIGIDIQSISELFPETLPTDLKVDDELLQIFTTKELSYAQSKPKPKETLTGLYAAKEAIFKSTSTHKNFLQIEILPNSNGKPCVENFEVSISHSGEYAIAVAIAWTNVEIHPPEQFRGGSQLHHQNKESGARNKSIYPLLIGLILIIEIVFHILMKIN
jgi:phosphopantetheine--protein transferase-like protein